MNSITADDFAGKPEGYRVEVSGWDAQECFFVERCMLIWTKETGKRLELNALVRIGSILFVRLIQPLGSGISFPVPYRAVEVQSNHRGLRGVVTLEQLQPRMAFRQTNLHLVDSPTRVA